MYSFPADFLGPIIIKVWVSPQKCKIHINFWFYWDLKYVSFINLFINICSFLLWIGRLCNLMIQTRHIGLFRKIFSENVRIGKCYFNQWKINYLRNTYIYSLFIYLNNCLNTYRQAHIDIFMYFSNLSIHKGPDATTMLQDKVQQKKLFSSFNTFINIP